MTSMRGSTRLNRTLEVASSLHNTITALVERNGCKFSTTLDLGELEVDEVGQVVLRDALELNPFAPPQVEPLYHSAFVAPEHKTLRQPSKTYQVDQVEHLPPNGMLSDSEDDTDEELEKDMGRKFNHKPLTQSPFKASGKLSVHHGTNYREASRGYQVEMLPEGEWAGEEVGFSPRLGDDEGDSDDEDEQDRILAEFAAVEAQVERDDKKKREEEEKRRKKKKSAEEQKERAVDAKQTQTQTQTQTPRPPKTKVPTVPKLNLKNYRRPRPSPRTNKIHSLTSRLNEKKKNRAALLMNKKGSLSARDVATRDISTAETDKTDEDLMTHSTTNTTAIGSGSNNNRNDTILSAINWGMTREEMDAIAKNYDGLVASPVKVKTKKKGKPFCNYKKYQEMQKETKGGDWYLFQDGTPYVSKWEIMRAKEKGDPDKLMEPGGFRRFFGKQSEWHVHEFGIRNSSAYEGHQDEAGLVDGRADKKLKHKWVDNKGWKSIGTSIKPHWGRRNAKGFKGMHGNINENTTHSEFGAHFARGKEK